MSKEMKLVKIDDENYVLKNVPVVYTSLAKPKEFTDDDGNTSLKYEVTALITEDIADEWDAENFKQSSKKVGIKAGEKTFEERFKFERPEWVAEKKFFRIILRQKAQYKDKTTGEMKLWEHDKNARPKTFKMTGDNKRVDITDQMIGNGSIADVLVKVYNNTHPKYGGLQASVAGIVVTDMVEMEQPTDRYDPFAAYGEVEVPSFDDAPAKPAPQKVASESAEQIPAGLDADFDDDIPF